MTVRLIGSLVALMLMCPLAASADEGDLFQGVWGNNPVDTGKRGGSGKQLPAQITVSPTELPAKSSESTVPAAVPAVVPVDTDHPAGETARSAVPLAHDLPKEHVSVEPARAVEPVPKETAVTVSDTTPMVTPPVTVSSGVPEMQTGDDYVIGIGDLLDISVWRDETLTKTVLVLPDGTIFFPLIDRIPASGLSVRQLKEKMVAELSRYIPGLTLSLDVRQINSMVIYVIGRVNGPGRFAMTAPINVLQGLAMAGGLNPFAKRDDIKVFRQADQGQQILPFHYDRVIRGELLSENVMLQRGDLIVVP